MTRYENIFNAFELECAIASEMERNGIRGRGYAVLAEGNCLGEFHITVLTSQEVSDFDEDELADAEGYGYAVCGRIEDVRRYAHDYFA